MISLRWVIVPALITMVFAGCRFGNSESNHDRVRYTCRDLSQYYRTQYINTTLCSTHNGVQKCGGGTTADIPTRLIQIMTDPIALILVDPTGTPEKGNAQILNRQQADGIKTYIQSSSGQVDYRPEGSKGALLSDFPDCLSTLTERHTGTVSRSQYGEVNGGYLTCGSTDFTLELGTEFSPECGTVLKILRDCYTEFEKCDGLDQEEVRAIFEPFIDAGTMPVDGILNTQKLHIRFHYGL